MAERRNDPLFWQKLQTWLLGAVLLVMAATCACFVWTAAQLNRYEAQVGDIVDRLDRVSARLEELDTEAIVRTANEVTNALEAAKIAEIVDSLQEVTARLRAVDWEDMASNVNELTLQAQKSLAAAQEALAKASESMDQIDFEALNQAVTDLKTVVEPLARLVGKFN